MKVVNNSLRLLLTGWKGQYSMFDKMTLEELVCYEGYDCSCGRHHVCGMDYLKIGRGVLDCVPQMVAAMGKKRPFVVCDDNTWRVAGQRVCTLLGQAGIEYESFIIPCHGERILPAEWEVGSVVMHFDRRCDMLLGVGSGVVNDICKVVAQAAGVPSAIVGTAPSMDGYASNSASMERNGVKVSLYTGAPRGILLDADILAQAPMRMLWAGLGDMVAKYIAVCEWRVSAIVCDEPYCENIAQMMRTALRRIVAVSDRIPSRDPDAIQSIAEGLVLAGIAMAYANISRPASGLEHYFSHMWEIMALEKGEISDLHGIQVGVGTMLCMKLYGKILREVTPDRAKAEAHMAAFDRVVWEEQVRRIFGKASAEVIAIEEKTKKNSPERHAKRLERIIAHWDEILKCIEEELPAYEELYKVLAATGMPLTPAELGLSIDQVVDAFVGARDIRDKYLFCSLLWDLGLTEEFAAHLRRVAND